MSPISSDVSRRQLLRTGALGLTGLAAAPMLGACSTAGGSASSKTVAWETGYLSFFFFVVL